MRRFSARVRDDRMPLPTPPGINTTRSRVRNQRSSRSVPSPVRGISASRRSRPPHRPPPRASRFGRRELGRVFAGAPPAPDVPPGPSGSSAGASAPGALSTTASASGDGSPAARTDGFPSPPSPPPPTRSSSVTATRSLAARSKGDGRRSRPRRVRAPRRHSRPPSGRRRPRGTGPVPGAGAVRRGPRRPTRRAPRLPLELPRRVASLHCCSSVFPPRAARSARRAGLSSPWCATC